MPLDDGRTAWFGATIRAQDTDWERYHRAAGREFSAGRVDRAERFLRISLDHARAFPADDPRLADTFRDLGRLLHVSGRDDEAVEYLLKSLFVHDRIGPSVESARVFDDLASVYLAVGDLRAAETMAGRAQDLLDAVLDEGDVRRYDGRIRSAEIRLERGEASAAEALLREALAANESHARPRTEVVARIRSWIARVHIARGDHESAEAVLRGAIDSLATRAVANRHVPEESTKADRPSDRGSAVRPGGVGVATRTLAAVLLDTARVVETPVAPPGRGRTPLDTCLRICRDLAGVLLETGRVDAACELLSDTIRLRERCLGPLATVVPDEDLARLLERAASSLRRKGDPGEASRVERAADGLRQSLGWLDPRDALG